MLSRMAQDRIRPTRDTWLWGGRRSLLGVAGAMVLCLVLAACAGPRGLVITGKTLEAISDQFVATSALYNKLLDDGVIDRAEYDAYKEWGLKFQKEFPKAVDNYKIIADCTLRAIKTPEAGTYLNSEASADDTEQRGAPSSIPAYRASTHLG